jgi:hypothetical protein
LVAIDRQQTEKKLKEFATFFAAKNKLESLNKIQNLRCKVIQNICHTVIIKIVVV